jgi:two-component system, sensor histidine kinase and response regulator
MNSNMVNWHILVVEDEKDGQEIASNLLGYFGVVTDLASSAEEALDLLDSSPYTAAVIDLMLPGMDGFELSRIIRANPYIANLPCIAVTAYHSSTIRKQALEAGYNGFYPKPLDYEGFIEELRRIIEYR